MTLEEANKASKMFWSKGLSGSEFLEDGNFYFLSIGSNGSQLFSNLKRK